MPFFRDPAGRPIAKPAIIDDYIRELNQCNYDDKKWRDNGIDCALAYENDQERHRKELDEKIIEAQRPPRSRF